MTRVRYAGVAPKSPLPGGGNPFHAIETWVSFHDGEPIISLVVRTHVRETADEIATPGGMGMSVGEAQRLDTALGEAIKAAGG